MSDIVERLRERADKFHASYSKSGEDDCWEWNGSLTPTGYGRFWITRRTGTTASRAAMMLTVGEIPPDLEVCHKCDNRRCVNPNHLFLGTPKENSQDRVRKGRNISRRGEAVTNAKLTESDVMAIRTSSTPHRQLAREYGVDESLIRQVRNKKGWKHV